MADANHPTIRELALVALQDGVDPRHPDALIPLKSALHGPFGLAPVITERTARESIGPIVRRRTGRGMFRQAFVRLDDVIRAWRYLPEPALEYLAWRVPTHLRQRQLADPIMTLLLE